MSQHIPNIALASTIALSVCLGPSVHADFTGLSAQSFGQCSGGQCCCVVELHACFDEPTDVLINVFNASISLPAGWVFLQSLMPPSWAPQFTTACDSWVTIGGVPGLANSTTLDPNWVSMPSSLNNTGWFNGNPVNQQGKVNAAGKVLIGRFAVVGVPNIAPVLSVAQLCVTWNNGPGTPSAATCIDVPVAFPYACQPLGTSVTYGCGAGCQGDTNADGGVDGGDLGGMLGAWGTNDPQYDLNDDGIVNGADVGLLLGAWGSCD